MPDSKISQLTAGAPALTTDVLPAQRGAANRKLTVQDILSVPSATSGVWGAASSVFGKVSAALGIGADLDTAIPAFGAFIVIRQNSDGGIILATCELGLGTITIVSDPSARAVVGADPGAGANKLWLASIAGPAFRIRNRYVAAKNVSVAFLSLGGVMT